VNRLPDTFSVDEIIEKMILLEKIETGLKESKNNQIVPDDELDSHLPKWLV
jgi:hypothetical protein